MTFFQETIYPKKKDQAYVISLNDKNSKGTPWVSLIVDKNVPAYFDSFGIEYIPLEALN